MRRVLLLGLLLSSSLLPMACGPSEKFCADPSWKKTDPNSPGNCALTNDDAAFDWGTGQAAPATVPVAQPGIVGAAATP